MKDKVLCNKEIKSGDNNIMLTYYAIGKYRSLKEADDITYKNGILHPSRQFPDFHDIVYMINGSWEIIVNDQKYTIFPGDVIILPAGYYHFSEKVCSPGTRTFFIHVSPVVGDTTVSESPKNDGISRIPLNTIIHCQNNDVVYKLFEEIVTMYTSNHEMRDEMVSVMIQTLLYYLYRCDNRTMMHNYDIADKCLDIMRAMPNIIFKDSEMAQQLFVSVKTLRNSFMKRFNKTFYQYQLDYKLNQVCVRLIDNPEMRLYEIAYDLGFCDEFHLSKVFKKKYGVSPKDYRRNV